VQAYRKKLLAKQGGKCKLCEKPIAQGQATLDHCHTNGRVRAVLHRACNGAEGRIKHWVRRSGAADHFQFLQNILDLWQACHLHHPVHPNHRTKEEKEIRRLTKLMKGMKTERGRQRYEDKIAKLKEGL